MKLFRSLFLAGCLLVAPAVLGQKIEKGYDLGACSEDGFFAGHAKIEEKRLVIDLVSEREGEVIKPDRLIVYDLEEEKDLKKVYQHMAGDHKLELALDFEKKIGVLMVDGVPQSIIFMKEDATGDKLAANAMDEFKACVEFVNGQTKDLVN